MLRDQVCYFFTLFCVRSCCLRLGRNNSLKQGFFFIGGDPVNLVNCDVGNLKCDTTL